MKIAVKASIFMICIIFMILIIMAITSSSTRTNEGENALAAAVEQSLAQLENGVGYDIGDYEEWLADFSQALLAQISSDSDISIDVLAADTDAGVLDILVTEKYITVNGKEQEATCRKTVLFEAYDSIREFHAITFQAEGSIFRQYSMYTGESITDPGIPEMEGRTFQHWTLSGSGEAADIGSMTVDDDMTFVAVFH